MMPTNSNHKMKIKKPLIPNMRYKCYHPTPELDPTLFNIFIQMQNHTQAPKMQGKKGFKV